MRREIERTARRGMDVRRERIRRRERCPKARDARTLNLPGDEPKGECGEG